MALTGRGRSMLPADCVIGGDAGADLLLMVFSEGSLRKWPSSPEEQGVPGKLNDSSCDAAPSDWDEPSSVSGSMPVLTGALACKVADNK